MTTTVQGWQTGIARQNGVEDQTVTYENITLIKKMLTHTAEAEGEMLDFKDMFGEYFKTNLPQYKYFLSVGSSSTQAWKINDDGTYEVIDPTKLNNDGKDNFETMGVMKSINQAGATDLTNYLISQNLNENNKVLCFNAIGYKVPSGNTPVKITMAINIDTNSSYLIDLLKGIGVVNFIDIFPRKGELSIKGINEQISGQWARGYAKSANQYLVDIGGGAVHLYNPKGIKTKESLIDPTVFYGEDFSPNRDKMLLTEIIKKITPLIHPIPPPIMPEGVFAGGKRSRRRGKKSKKTRRKGKKSKKGKKGRRSRR
jgi:hypothetical protein